MSKKIIATLQSVNMQKYIYYVSGGTEHGGSKIIKPAVYRIPRAGMKKTALYKPSERERIKKENKKNAEMVMTIPPNLFNSGHIIVVNKNGDVVDCGPRHENFKKGEKNIKFRGYMDFDAAKKWHERERSPESIEMDETQKNKDTREPIIVNGKKKIFRSWQDRPGSMDWVGIDDVNEWRKTIPWRQINFPKEKIAPFLSYVLANNYRPKKDIIKQTWKNRLTREYVVVISHEGKSFSTIWYKNKNEWGIEIERTQTLSKAMKAANDYIDRSGPYKGSLPGGTFKGKK